MGGKYIIINKNAVTASAVSKNNRNIYRRRGASAGQVAKNKWQRLGQMAEIRTSG